MTRVGASLAEHHTACGQRPALGTIGRLAILVWSYALILLAPDGRLVVAISLTFAVNTLLYPKALKRLLRWRWLVFACLLVVPSMLWGGEVDQVLGAIPYSSSGLTAGLNMILRALVLILAIDGFSTTVDISEVAGLLERAGLPGLGFSMGVAVNLLPALRKSSQNAWRALQMRGGFRHQRWRALQLFLITVVTNALHRAEEIALAAEVRAFSVEQSRALPLRAGKLDAYLVIVLSTALLFLMLAP